jgi:mycothiol synthase
VTAEKTADEPVLAWQSGLDDDSATEVTALLTAATAADGTAPVSENTLLHLREAGGMHLLAHNGADLLGYAYLDTNVADGAVSELAVHPAHRRRGVGTALVSALLDRAAGRTLQLWAHGEHPGALRLARRLGFQRVRTLWQMRRGLLEPALPEAEFPPGVQLRSFVVGRDEPEFLRVNNAAFAWHPEQGGWDLEQVKVREAAPWFDPNGFLLAVEPGTDGDERLLGFHWTKVHTTPERIGEVYVLGVDPAAQGRKLGRALTLAGMRYLRDKGLPDVMLYVEADNHAAVKVYQNLGFTRWHTDAAFRH